MFIVYKDILINAADVSWAKVTSDSWYCASPKKPFALLVHFRGVSEYLQFHFETEEEAKNAFEDFMTLIRLATNKDNK